MILLTFHCYFFISFIFPGWYITESELQAMEEQLKKKATEEKVVSAKRDREGDKYTREEPSNKRSKPSDSGGLHDSNDYTLHQFNKKGFYSDVWATYNYFDRKDHPQLKRRVKCRKCGIEFQAGWGDYSNITLTPAMKRHASSCSNVHRNKGYDFEAATLAAQNEDGMVAPHRSFISSMWNHYFFSAEEVGDGTNVALFNSARQIRCRYCEMTFTMKTLRCGQYANKAHCQV